MQDLYVDPYGRFAPERWLALLHLASPQLPLGAFSYSEGLESAVETGWVRDRASAAQWFTELLAYAIAPLDAPLWLRLYAAWRTEDMARAAQWNAEYLASRETAELRAQTVQMGYSLQRLLTDLDPEHFPPLGWAEPSLPSLHARAAAAWGLSAEEGLLAWLWGWLENQVMVAVKLIPLGQTDGQRLLRQLSAHFPTLIAQAQALSDGDLAGGLPGLALASCAHETQYSRLFRS